MVKDLGGFGVRGRCWERGLNRALDRVSPGHDGPFKETTFSKTGLLTKYLNVCRTGRPLLGPNSLHFPGTSQQDSFFRIFGRKKGPNWPFSGFCYLEIFGLNSDLFGHDDGWRVPGLPERIRPAQNFKPFAVPAVIRAPTTAEFFNPSSEVLSRLEELICVLQESLYVLSSLKFPLNLG